MEFSCNLEELKTIAINVALAINSKTNSVEPTLEGLLLKCENNKLTLTGYDLSIGIVKTFPINQKQEGSIILKAQLFVEILRKLQGNTVNINVTDKLIATIKTEHTEYKLAGINAENYPNLPNLEQEDIKKINIKESTLKNGIFKTLYAVSLNTMQNPILCGSLFEINENKLNIISVDGYRVAISICTLEQKSQPLKFVVASKTLSEIYKLLSEENDKITEIDITSNHIAFNISGYYIISRLLQGSFLDYKAAIPKTETSSIIISPNILEESIQRVSVMITPKVSVVLNLQSDGIYLNCESTLGKATDIIKTKTNGELLEKIAFNNKFMLDALKHCQCEEIKITFNGAIMPIKIEPTEGKNFLYLVLPVRIK